MLNSKMKRYFQHSFGFVMRVSPERTSSNGTPSSVIPSANAAVAPRNVGICDSADTPAPVMNNTRLAFFSSPPTLTKWLFIQVARSSFAGIVCNKQTVWVSNSIGPYNLMRSDVQLG